jgi:8-oxo-dGTP pyrophosphatase MutT (NUDIX family)
MSEEKILKAGAIILSSLDKNKVAILYRGKQNDWSFPKGHVELGENSTETMVREIKEETGLDTDIIKELPDLEYVHSDGQNISIKMFLVMSKDDSRLKLEFEKDEIEWVQFDEVNNKLSHDNLKEYFTYVLPMIQSIT